MVTQMVHESGCDQEMETVWVLRAKGTYSGTRSKGVARLEEGGGEGRSPKMNDCRQVSATSLGQEMPRGPRILNQCDAADLAAELSCFSRNPGVTLPGCGPCHYQPRLSPSSPPNKNHKEEGRELLLPTTHLPCQRLLFWEPRGKPFGGSRGAAVCGASALRTEDRAKKSRNVADNKQAGDISSGT